MPVDFGTYDPRGFAQPGDPDLTFDLNHVVVTNVVAVNLGQTMSVIVFFAHGIGRWCDIDGIMHDRADPVSGTLACDVSLGSGEDDFEATYAGTLDAWCHQVTSLHFTAAPNRSALLVGDEGWISFPPTLTISIV